MNLLGVYMYRFLIRFCLALSLVFLFAQSSIAISASDAELQVFKVQTEAKMEAAKEIQQKDLQLHQQLVASQNERIEQINHQVDWLGHLIVLGSLIITLLLVGIGYVTYGKAKNDAKETAKDEAQKWFDANMAAMNKEIDALRTKLQQTTKEVDEHAELAHQNIEKSNEAVRAHASQIIAANPPFADAKTTLSDTDKQTLTQASDSLKDKPESQYTFDDWNTRAHAAYAENAFALAEEYWKKASGVTGATDEQVAHALLNQGVMLGRQGKPEEEIAYYQQVVKRYGDSSLPVLQECVARALDNQGATLVKQGLHEEAIACCQKVVASYGDSSLPVLQECVARALNGHGFTQLIQAKHSWNNEIERTKLLSESLALLERAKEKVRDTKVKAMVLGNVAYVLWLMGRDGEVEMPLREAFRWVEKRYLMVRLRM